VPYRPPSRRGKADHLFDELQEGIPDYLLEPVQDWIDAQVTSARHPQDVTLRTLQSALRLQPPLAWGVGGRSAARSLHERVARERELGLDVLDFLLHFSASAAEAKGLQTRLLVGGSAWEVTPAEQGRNQLTRRAVGPVVESIEAIRSVSGRAHHHLATAWSNLAGRNPDPSTAYRESVRAVEAAAKPVVTPNDNLATLGKIIRALRDKPKKWTYVLEGTAPEDVAAMAESIWTGQLDRHGTDDESVPLTVSQEQADAAFYVSLALTRIFAGRLLDTA